MLSTIHPLCPRGCGRPFQAVKATEGSQNKAAFGEVYGCFVTETDTRGLGGSSPGCVVGGLDPCWCFLRIGYDTEKLIRVSAAPRFPPRVVKAIPIPAKYSTTTRLLLLTNTALVPM